MGSTTRPVLVIHGGCGVIARKSMTPEYENDCREALKKSLQTGYDILKAGGSAVDAVVAAVMYMEDDPHFNAGKGSVFTTSYTHEMDAGIMDGRTGAAGGVTTLTRIKNPILLARRVMDKTPHTVLSGPGAETFAEKRGLEMVDPKYFFTENRLNQLKRLLEKSSSGVSSKVVPVTPQLDHDIPNSTVDEKPHDTVGAVALDLGGHLASASSTGGMTGKMPGRVSDSAIPGAGYWADGEAAFSITGNGDVFLRRAGCHEMASLVKYANMNADRAAKKVIFETLKDCHAGVVAVDAAGNFSMPYNSEGMFRGYISEKGMDVLIWEH